MEHEQAKELIEDFRDGELPPAQRDALSRHLDVCRPCRDLLAESERIARAFFPAACSPTGAEMESFVERVMGEIRREQPALTAPAVPDYRWFVPAMGLAFAALLLSFMPAGADPADPAGTLLMEGASGSVFSEWITDQESPLPEDPLQLVMEEP